MCARPPFRCEFDADWRRLAILGLRGDGGIRSTMDEVASAFAKTNGAGKSLVLRLELLVPGREEGR